MAMTAAPTGVPKHHSARITLVLAALTTVVALGVLAADSGRSPASPGPPVAGGACPAGSTPDAPGRADQARPPISDYAAMALDRRAGRIVLLASGDDGLAPQTWTFDVCANAWTRMSPGREPQRAMGPLVYDADSDVTIALDGLQAWAYDLDANRWTEGRSTPFVARRALLATYDRVSGLVIVAVFTNPPETLPAELWSYDVETDSWARVWEVNPPAPTPGGDYRVMSYDPRADRIVSYGPTADPSPWTRLFDLRSGLWSPSGTTSPYVGFGWDPSGGEVAYDDAIGRTVIFGDATVIAYDGAEDRWETLLDEHCWECPNSWPLGVTARISHAMVYDPINARLVVYGGQHRSTTWGDFVRTDDVLAFDPVTREWSVLLATSREVPPAP